MPEKTQGFTKDQGEDSKEVFQLFDMKGDDLIQAIIVITNIVLAKSAALQSNTIHLRGIIAGTNLCDHAPRLPLLLLPLLPFLSCFFLPPASTIYSDYSLLLFATTTRESR